MNVLGNIAAFGLVGSIIALVFVTCHRWNPPRQSTGERNGIALRERTEERIQHALRRHPAGRRSKVVPGLPVDGERLTVGDWEVLDALEFSDLDEWNVLAIEAESFSADKDKRGD